MTFVEQLAADLYDKYGDQLSEVTVVFPSRRAGVFFRRAISSLLDKPIWSPKILGVEEFFHGLSNRVVPDVLMLNFILFQVNNKIMGAIEPLDRFLPWGELLIKDFDDIDKYLINPEKVFTTVAEQKEIDLIFDYLSEDQKSLIRSFWERFSERESKQKSDFLKVWKKLPQIYKTFRQNLIKQNFAYNGLLQHEICDKIDARELVNPYEKVVFAGFYALTPAEEKVITHFITSFDAEIFWDFDNYYVSDERQEAGRFIREHAQKNAFQDSLKKPWPDELSKIEHLEIIATPFQIGQTKKAGELLKGMSSQELEKTVIVIPDDQMLFPTLYALPEQVDKINITMGYPLKSSPLYNLVDLLLKLQLTAKPFGENDYRFYHKQVLGILRHPFLKELFGKGTDNLINDIERYNQIYVKSSSLILGDFAKLVFRLLDDQSQYFEYVRDILPHIIKPDSDLSKEDVTLGEFIYQTIKELNKLETIIISNDIQLTVQEFHKLVRQIMRSVRVPFDGEPLQGLQIMGVLETRNLDFDTVIFLGLNEGLMPASGGLHSYIPYNLRKAFTLPTFDQQDSIYAYLFYRLLQRSTKSYLFYNSEATQRISGEPSRYIQQLRMESGLAIKESVLVNPIHFEKSKPIVVQKSSQVMAYLKRYIEGAQIQAFTPSAISTYLDCRLRFYFKYIQRIKEPEELEEEIDNRIFGNILHKALENVYETFIQENNSSDIQESDFVKISTLVNSAVDSAFRSQFHVEEKEFQYEGRNIVIFEMIQKMVNKVLAFDKKYTPFKILGLEKDDYEVSLDLNILGGKHEVLIKGGIDRVDLKNNTVRIIDYKTGKDNRKFTDIPSLFDRDDKSRNKAAMQTLLYSFLYFRNQPNDNYLIQPGLFNAREMFGGNFDPALRRSVAPKKFENVTDARLLFAEFQEELTQLLEELLHDLVPFDQTDDIMKCSYCPYKLICDR